MTKLAKRKVKIVDATEALPTHRSKVWKKRNRFDIRGVIVHQSASDGSMFNVAKYHVTPTYDRDGNGIIEAWERNHISPEGCAGICYTFGIIEDGTIYIMNDIEDIVWHAKSKNATHLGIVLFGNFSGPSWEGTREPSNAQLDSLKKLLDHIQNELLKENEIPKSKFLGHCEVDPINKENCPGTKIMEVLNEWREA